MIHTEKLAVITWRGNWGGGRKIQLASYSTYGNVKASQGGWGGEGEMTFEVKIGSEG